MLPSCLRESGSQSDLFQNWYDEVVLEAVAITMKIRTDRMNQLPTPMITNLNMMALEVLKGLGPFALPSLTSRDRAAGPLLLGLFLRPKPVLELVAAFSSALLVQFVCATANFIVKAGSEGSSPQAHSRRSVGSQAVNTSPCKDFLTQFGLLNHCQ